jgi:hypothetical protein
VVTGSVTASAMVTATTSVGGVTVSSGGLFAVRSGAVVSGVTVLAGGTKSGAGAIIGSSLVAGSASGLTLGVRGLQRRYRNPRSGRDR